MLGARWTAFKINSVNVRPQVHGGLSEDVIWKTSFVLLFRRSQTWTIIIIDLWFLNVTSAGQELTFKSRVPLCSTALFITALKIKLQLPRLRTTAHVVNLTVLPSEVQKIPGYVWFFFSRVGQLFLAPLECCGPDEDACCDIDKITTSRSEWGEVI